MTGLALLSCIVSLAIHAGTPDGAETAKELLEETTSNVIDAKTGKTTRKRLSDTLGVGCAGGGPGAWIVSNSRDIIMVGTLISLIGIGCAFFMVHNGMDFTDAFYLCIITATTIGLGDLSPGFTKGICGIDGLCANKASLNETCVAHDDCSRESVRGKWFGVFFMMLSVMGLTGVIGRLSDVLARKKFKEKINQSLSKLEISAELFEFVDADSDGNIDKSEWFAACVKRLELLDPIFYQIIEDNFAKLDVTGDGSINRDDVAELLQKRDDNFARISEENSTSVPAHGAGDGSEAGKGAIQSHAGPIGRADLFLNPGGLGAIPSLPIVDTVEARLLIGTSLPPLFHKSTPSHPSFR